MLQCADRDGRRASPHTRGWTHAADRRAIFFGGFPAHAGMDPARSSWAAVPSRLPRTRGDGPPGGGKTASRPMASPHTRGWTRCPDRGGPARIGFPAHAGMDPGRSVPRGVPGGLPRTRGDGPPPHAAVSSHRSASPHTRGWTRQRASPDPLPEGFPAHAGMDPGQISAMDVRDRLPRTRGDGPSIDWTWIRYSSASPHTRGWTRRGGSARAGDSGFPAHAGMDPCGSGTSWSRTRLPRTRGDGPVHDPSSASVIMASPHTRGWTPVHDRIDSHDGGFPAHAGMDPLRGTRRMRRSGLPRTRGDGPGSAIARSTPRSASPHTRGWTRRAEDAQADACGFPAHAGMDPHRAATAILG